MKKFKFNYFNLFLYAVVLFLAVEVIILVKQNRDLRIRIQFLQPQLAEGDSILNIPVLTLDQLDKNLSFNGGQEKTILLVFSTSCHFCTQTIPYWNNLFNDFSDKYKILSILTENLNNSTHEYIKENNIQFDIYFPTENDFNNKYKMHGVPKTILIDKKGKIEKVWTGLIDSNIYNKIKNIL